jgi:hypothetical protein
MDVQNANFANSGINLSTGEQVLNGLTLTIVIFGAFITPRPGCGSQIV